MSNIQDLMQFNNVCDEFIEGKYILADIKIAALLKVIAANEKIKNIIASCSENFNFNRMFAQLAVEDEAGNCKFALPNAEEDKIAFIFGLLYRFDNKVIDLYQFLNKFFRADDDESAGKEFLRFAETIIIPFKSAIHNIYRHIIKESEDYQNDCFNKIMQCVQNIAKQIDSFKLKANEKEEFIMLLNSLYLASESNDKKLVYSLMIGIDYFSKCNKRTRNAYLSLEECFE